MATSKPSPESLDFTFQRAIGGSQNNNRGGIEKADAEVLKSIVFHQSINGEQNNTPEDLNSKIRIEAPKSTIVDENTLTVLKNEVAKLSSKEWCTDVESHETFSNFVFK